MFVVLFCCVLCVYVCCLLFVVGGWLLVVDYGVLFVVCYCLFSMCCMVPWVSFDVHRLLFDVRCVLFVVCPLSGVVRCLPFLVYRRSLCIVCCLSFVVCCLLFGL